MVTIETARQAKDELVLQIHGIFNGLVSMVGVGKAGQDFCVSVGMTREPLDHEKASLPDTYKGVQVQYEVIGEVRAL